jgi:predicted alpha-1,6-mannanase (GH76 family)
VLVDAYTRTADAKYKSRMTALVNGIKDTNGGTYLNDYYDDMEWLALSSLRAYHATDDAAFLDLTKLLWSDIKTGLNTNQGGGIAWRKTQLDYKNTPANAPAIILACRLYAMEQSGADLQLAKDVYAWLKNTLVDPATGLAWDGINRTENGQIDKWMFTYNQGVWIGAGLELYKVTNEQSYLNDAIKAADYVVNDVQFFPNGVMKAEGDGDGGLFKGILVRYLTLLSKDINVPKTKRDIYSGVINFNAKTLFDKGIKRPAMLIGPNWTQRPGSSTDLSAQLSGLMLIEAVASYED